MEITILGPGCANCRRTEEIVRRAVLETGTEAFVHKVRDLSEIMAFKVMMTPAVAIDGEVKISGRVPTVNEVKRLLSGKA